jgi:hypothetical protein
MRQQIISIEQNVLSYPNTLETGVYVQLSRKYLPSQGREGFASNTSDSTPKDTPLEDTRMEIPVNEEVAQQAKKLLHILSSDDE